MTLWDQTTVSLTLLQGSLFNEVGWKGKGFRQGILLESHHMSQVEAKFQDGVELEKQDVDYGSTEV